MNRKKITLGCLLFLVLMLGMSTSVWASAPGIVNIAAQKSESASKRYTLYWGKVKDASGYQLELYNLSKKAILKKTVKSGATTKYTLSGVAAGEFYRLRIRAYRIDRNPVTGVKKTVYGKYRTTYIAQQPKVKFSWVNKTSSNARWTAVDGASSYDVYISQKRGSGFKRTARVRTNQAVLKKLKMNTNYYVYVVANLKTKSATFKTPKSYTYSFRLQMK